MEAHHEFWEDVATRRAALVDILSRWDAGDIFPLAQLQRIDDVVVAVLKTSGFPRGPVSGLRLVESINGGKARKTKECVLEFSVADMRAFVDELNQPDDVVRSWIHESVHARQFFAPNADDEYHSFPGVEEGLVENVTMIVVRETGIRPLDLPRTRFTVAYQILAEIIGIPTERLVRELFKARTGEVSQMLPSVVALLIAETQNRDLGGRNQLRLIAAARQVFNADRVQWPLIDEEVRDIWRRALQ